ncbi:MAG: M23 family metallopeptidase [Eubacteriales bacterium]|nr:M23 family metallopeptidase [Eubacteriales bacterium]
MFISFSINKAKSFIYSASIVIVMILAIRCTAYMAETAKKKDYIKWVDFNLPYSVMQSAIEIDINTYDTDCHIKCTDLMAYASASCYGNFSSYKKSTLSDFKAKIEGGEDLEDITKDLKLFPYYQEMYNSIFSEWLGEYKTQNGEYEYGLKVYSPVAQGYYFSHYDDFGNGRNYGYRRKHLGNDLMGGTGAPIIAIEDGYIEALGWNQYGGWRIGIRSFDGKRYYYYAHLRKDFPYNKSLYEGSFVKAGDVIGYLGQSGYSSKENTNNINVPHLHLGLQLIFDESQKDGINQIWIDMYNIVEYLNKNKSPVIKDEATGDYYKAQ